MQLLLETSYLLERGIIDNNVDVKKLNHVIEVAQDIYIRPKIGTKLFNELKTQSIPPASGLTPANTTLLNDYVLPVLVLVVQGLIPVMLRVRYMNKGLMVASSEAATPITSSEAKELKDQFISLAESYTDDMKRFIIANLDDYPLYYANNGLDERNPEPASTIDIFLSNYPEPKYRNDIGELNG